MVEDHLMVGAATIFWALIETQPTVARAFGNQAMTLWQENRALRDRCNINLSNWDTPCAHAMLLLVQVRCLPAPPLPMYLVACFD